MVLFFSLLRWFSFSKDGSLLLSSSTDGSLLQQLFLLFSLLQQMVLFFKRWFSSSLFFAALTLGCPVPACGNCQSWPVTRCRYASGLRRFLRSARVSSFTFDRAGKSAKSSQDDLYGFKLYKWGCHLVNFDSIRLRAYVVWITWCFKDVLTQAN